MGWRKNEEAARANAKSGANLHCPPIRGGIFTHNLEIAIFLLPSLPSQTKPAIPKTIAQQSCQPTPRLLWYTAPPPTTAVRSTRSRRNSASSSVQKRRDGSARPAGLRMYQQRTFVAGCRRRRNSKRLSSKLNHAIQTQT